MVAIVGILSLQGNYIQHKNIFNKLNYDCSLVRYPSELKGCKLLILPGGESTAISKQIKRNGFLKAIKDFSKSGHIFGTCAGMILMSSADKTKHVESMEIMNFDIIRNAYGSQISSFTGVVNLHFDKSYNFNGSFIRAPKIKRIGKNIKVLASYLDEPVMITDGQHFASSFHPEIGLDYRIHKYILDEIDV